MTNEFILNIIEMPASINNFLNAINIPINVMKTIKKKMNFENIDYYLVTILIGFILSIIKSNLFIINYYFNLKYLSNFNHYYFVMIQTKTKVISLIIIALFRFIIVIKFIIITTNYKAFKNFQIIIVDIQVILK